jgi:MFS transporter, SHS family, sialic acid transporter
MTPDPASRRGQWLTLAAALLGWMFDGLEMGLFPLVARPALRDLLSDPTEAEVGRWFSVIIAGFLVGAATGGVLFGWLGDRIGRVRAMTLSVLTYAVFSGACGLSTNVWQVAGLRFVASLGMGGEWSLGVALVMEVWPDRSRAWLAGVIGAAANLGYMAIALVALAMTGVKDLSGSIASLGVGMETAAWLGANSGWRVLMLIGVLPAALTVLIQLFVPESGRWEAENRRGSTSHWQTRDLAGVLIGAAAGCGLIALWAVDDVRVSTRVAGSLLAIAVVTAGYLYPIVRYIQRAEAADRGRVDDLPVPPDALPADAGNTVPPGTALRAVIGRLMLAAALSGVALLGTWGSTQFAPTYADKLTEGKVPEAKAYTQAAAAFGAMLGCVGAALAGGWLGRRITYAVLCVGSMASIAALYQLNDSYGPVYLWWAFVAGTITAAFYGWLPLYLPELFRTKVRATGQGFGFNFGRIIAAVGVLQLPVVMKQLDVGWQGACTAMSAVYLVGLGLIWLAPETKGRPLPA